MVGAPSDARSSQVEGVVRRESSEYERPGLQTPSTSLWSRSRIAIESTDEGEKPRKSASSAPGRSRTCNLMGRNHLLYPFELQGPSTDEDPCPDHLRLVPH